jgi:hypothetical protein
MRVKIQQLMLCTATVLWLIYIHSATIVAPVFYVDINATNNPIAIMTPKKTGTENGKALQKLLDYAQAHGSHNLPVTIHVPKGDYRLGKKKQYYPIILSSYTNVKLADDVTFKSEGTLSFLGVPTDKRENGVENFHWTGGTLMGNGDDERVRFVLVEGRQLTFDNMTFERTSAFGDHAFDLNGVAHVSIQNTRFIGYGDRQLSNDRKVSPLHPYQSEAIQLDYNAIGSIPTNDRRTWRKIAPNQAKQVTIKGNHHVTIRESEFQPAVVHNQQLTHAQNPLGQHSYQADSPVQSSHIVFENNIVVDPVGGPAWQNDNRRNNYEGALHFNAVTNLVIRGNHFSQDDAQYFLSIYTNNDLPNSENVVIDDNTIESKKTAQLILFRTSTTAKDSGHIELRLGKNTYLIDGQQRQLTTKNVKQENFREEAIHLK